MNDTTPHVQANRARFLAALRSGDYPKGPIETDARGCPPAGAEGWCAVGLAYTLFTDDRRCPHPVPFRQALGLTRPQVTRIQQEWNDSPLTFAEIADRIAAELFREGPRTQEDLR